MSTTASLVVVFAALFVGVSAVALFARKPFVADPLVAYGVPRSWWPWLATAKALGALGLLAGLVVPAVGIAATVGLALYFTGAVVTIVRAKAYSHIPFPLVYLAPAVVAGWLIAVG